MKLRWLAFVLPMALLGASAPAKAQTKLPEIYQLEAVSQATEASMFSGRESRMKIYRDGTKELVVLTLAPKPDGTTMSMSYLFDFVADKAYSKEMESGSCSWMKYVSENAPTAYDPITGTSVLLKQGGSKTPKALGNATVAGVPVRMEEYASGEGGPTLTLWIGHKEGFALRGVVNIPGGQKMTYWDVKQINYTKPDASHFVAPTGCSHSEGTWSDSGVDAHATSETTTATASGSVDLADPSAAESKVSVTTSKEPGSAKVGSVWTDVFEYKGACPLPITFRAELQSTAPGVVKYEWVRSDNSVSPIQTVTFKAANETKIVQYLWRIPGKAGKSEKWAKVHLLSGDGSESSQTPFTLVCK